jgi:hypothetical protein
MPILYQAVMTIPILYQAAITLPILYQANHLTEYSCSSFSLISHSLCDKST